MNIYMPESAAERGSETSATRPGACAHERMVDAELLRSWPLPKPPLDGDKNDRGKVVIVAGSCEMPGAAILAAVAALRTGAGKLVIASGERIAALVAAAVPEARVVPLAEHADGYVGADMATRIAALVNAGDAVLIGPGMQHESALCELVTTLLPVLSNAKVVLDAAAMSVVCRESHAGNASAESLHRDPAHLRGSFTTPVLLTPHAGEMAHLTGWSKQAVLDAPAVCASDYAKRWRAVVALKGATTFIGAADGSVLRHDGGNPGLAVSGSGDVLSGIIVGLLARGASLRQAAAWGVAVHARAGEKLAARVGELGYLAREIADEVPRLLSEVA